MNRSFGIEVEYFITDALGRAPDDVSLSKLESSLIWQGYRPCKLQAEAPMDLLWESDHLSVRLHHDFYSHLIELSFAPAETPDAFLVSYRGAWSALRSASQEAGLTLHKSATLPVVPDGARFLFSGDAEIAMRHKVLDERLLPCMPFTNRYYYSQAAATHVHISSQLEADFSLLPFLYEMEYLIPRFFTNDDHSFSGVKALRPLWMLDSYSESYWASGIPIPLPVSFDLYRECLKQPEIVRDYSFIAPRPELRTLEFRTADSLGTPEEILSLTLLRLILMEVAGERRSKGETAPDLLKAKSHFRTVCITGRPAVESLVSHVPEILNRLANTKGKWGDFAPSLARTLNPGLNVY